VLLATYAPVTWAIIQCVSVLVLDIFIVVLLNLARFNHTSTSLIPVLPLLDLFRSLLVLVLRANMLCSSLRHCIGPAGFIAALARFMYPASCVFFFFFWIGGVIGSYGGRIGGTGCTGFTGAFLRIALLIRLGRAYRYRVEGQQ
jgi:hypothetical protein